MRAASPSKILVGLSLFSLGVNAGWPVKTVDLTNNGDDCELSREQYLMVEAHDFHDHPKLTMGFRQMTGPCGVPVDDSELLSWEVDYDGSKKGAEDDPPTKGGSGRVQLNLFVCAPFGEYEIDLDVESFSDEGSTLQQRTSWLIKNGPDQFHIWDTVNSDQASDEAYSPTVPGEYTWPLEDTKGYYGTFIAGPLPPFECAFSIPSGTELVGCFVDSSTDRLLDSAELVRTTRGPDGMTAQICSDFCSGFDFFGLEFGGECFCGTAEEFADSAVSDHCGLSSTYLCTGDPSMACGGRNAISVYQRIDYSLKGCFEDHEASRLMGPKGSAGVMSAEICFERCNNGINTHFGTQYARECWCGIETDLTKNGEVLPSVECDMLCAGTTIGEHCGGSYKMTAYEIKHDEPPLGYIGCYEDAPIRAMNLEGKYITGDMTNQVCISFCAEQGHEYAGTQYSVECWCGDRYDLYGQISDDVCSSSCEGDAGQTCGGSYALSVYATD